MNMHDPRFAAKPRRDWKPRPSRHDDIFNTLIRYHLWCLSLIILAALCTELVIRLSGIEVTNYAAVWYMPDALTLRNLALFFLLPLTLYWVFFLCAGWKDPFRARFWGVAAGVLMLFLLETYSFILHTVTLAQGTNPTALFITADFRQKALFLLIALAMTALMWLGYLLGPFRLVCRKWKDIPEEDDED